MYLQPVSVVCSDIVHCVSKRLPSGQAKRLRGAGWRWRWKDSSHALWLNDEDSRRARQSWHKCFKQRQKRGGGRKNEERRRRRKRMRWWGRWWWKRMDESSQSDFVPDICITNGEEQCEYKCLISAWNDITASCVKLLWPRKMFAVSSLLCTNVFSVGDRQGYSIWLFQFVGQISNWSYWIGAFVVKNRKLTFLHIAQKFKGTLRKHISSQWEKNIMLDICTDVDQVMC